MKIYYKKMETRGDITIEIKAEDEVDFEREDKDEAFTRISNFVEERLKLAFC